MAATKGFVLKQGSAGKKIEPGTIVYAGKHCLTEIYKEPTEEETKKKSENESKIEAETKKLAIQREILEKEEKRQNKIQKEKEEIDKILTAYEDSVEFRCLEEAQKVFEKQSIYGNFNTKGECVVRTKDLWFFENGDRDITYKYDGELLKHEIEPDENSPAIKYSRAKNNQQICGIQATGTNLSKEYQDGIALHRTLIIKNYEQDRKSADVNIGALTDKSKPHDISKLLEKQEEHEKKLQEQISKQKQAEFPTQVTSTITKWFDALEEYIDALPTMNQDGKMVYEVEYQKDGWYYNGSSYEMDEEVNRLVQEFKEKRCKELNAMLQQATDKVTHFIQGLADKVTAVGPIMKIINTLTSMSLSLDTIIDWATSVVDSFLWWYKLFKAYYQMVMDTLEMVIVRFPRLINKVSRKITEFNCPVTVKVTSVKINVKEKK